MKFNKILLVAPLLLAIGAHAAPPAGSFAKLSPKQQEAQAPTVLRQTAPDGTVFALGGIGRGGTRTDKFLAYEAVLRRSDAAAVFQKALTAPDAVTQLYALTGLAKCAPSVFRSVAPKYTNRQTPVRMMSGCIVFTRPLGDAVQDLRAGNDPATYRSPAEPSH